MPGCTVRGCSNSSAKGFKVHHFPSDLRRRLMWIKNCEREPTWEPSKYTCICEVHFESTQFESHRADGLQRLKPNAVPTLFNSRKSGSTRKSRNSTGTTILEQDHGLQEASRWSLIPERAEVPVSFLDAESCSDKLSPKRRAVSLTRETLSNELPLECESSNKFPTTFTDHNYPKGRPMHFQVQHTTPTDLTQAVGTDLFGMPPAISLEPSHSYRHNSLQESKLLAKLKNNDPVSSTANYSKSFSLLKAQGNVANRSEISTDKRSNSCFLCSEDITGTGKDPNTDRLATKAQAHLIKLLSDEPSLGVNRNKDLLCSHCTGLLSYVGRLETEASIINKAILNNLRRNNDITLSPGDFTLGDIGWQNIVDRCDPSDEHWTDRFSNEVSQSASTDLTAGAGTALVDMQQTTEGHQYECRLCNFQTPYRSLLIYHLRQHLTSSLVCDYCSTLLTEHDTQNTTEQSERQVSRINPSVVDGSHKDFPVKVHGIKDNDTVTSCDILISVETKNSSCKSMVGPSESMPCMQSSFQLISEETSETDPYQFLKEEMYQQCVSDENIENNIADLPGEVPADIFENNF